MKVTVVVITIVESEIGSAWIFELPNVKQSAFFNSVDFAFCVFINFYIYDKEALFTFFYLIFYINT